MLRHSLYFLMIPALAFAEPVTCPDNDIKIAEPGPFTEHICKAAADAKAKLAACNLPLERSVTISLSRDLDDNCVGIYHCGQDRIEIVPPETLAEMIADSALFSELGLMEYFDSILLHELAHAAFDDVPCPFATCPATSEYLAYSLQISTLSQEARERIGVGTASDQPISSESINPIMAFWAPDKFAVKAWTHLMQREDPCSFVGMIAAGDIRFDHEIPFAYDVNE